MNDVWDARWEANAAKARTANALWLVMACAMAACALIACMLFCSVPQAYADETPQTAHIEVFQKYETEWSGLADTFQYCLQAVTPAAPLPEEMLEGDLLDAEEGCFYFTMHRNDFEDTAEHPARVLLITLDPESEWPSRDRIDYRLYVSSLPELDFGYRRYYDGTSETIDCSELVLGTPEEQHDKMVAATGYDISLFPSVSPAGGNVFITYGNSQGSKVADPGWEIDFERTEGTVHFYPNRNHVTMHSAPSDEDALGTQSADEEVQTWRLGETRPLRKNTFVNGDSEFTGWNTEPDGSGTSYSDEQDYYMTPAGLTLYAQWTSVNASGGVAAGGGGSGSGSGSASDNVPDADKAGSNVLAQAVQSVFPKTGDAQATAIAVVVLVGLALIAALAVRVAWRRAKASRDTQED